jgi:hypothetical protein
MLFHPCHFLRQLMLVGLLTFLFFLSYILMHHFFLDCFLMHPFCFHHLGNPIQVTTYMSILPQHQICLLIWAICMIYNYILICCLVFHLISWEILMIIPKSSNLEWATKLHWVQGVLTIDGVLHNVRFKVCNTIDRKSCLFFFKWDTLMKHEGKRKGSNVNKGH